MKATIGEDTMRSAPATQTGFPQSPPVNHSTTVRCPFKYSDGPQCDKVCTGTRRYQYMIDHIEKKHPEYFVYGLSYDMEGFQHMLRNAPASTVVGYDAILSSRPATLVGHPALPSIEITPKVDVQSTDSRSSPSDGKASLRCPLQKKDGSRCPFVTNGASVSGQ